MASIVRLMADDEELYQRVMREHQARWFVYAGGYGQPLTRIPWQATMRGHWPGYDVECSCGWESKTGGATRASVRDALDDHRIDALAELRNDDEADSITNDDDGSTAPDDSCSRTGEPHQLNDYGFCRHCGIDPAEGR
jgi:hypothetical protein